MAFKRAQHDDQRGARPSTQLYAGKKTFKAGQVTEGCMRILLDRKVVANGASGTGQATSHKWEIAFGL